MSDILQIFYILRLTFKLPLNWKYRCDRFDFHYTDVYQCNSFSIQKQQI